MLAKYSANQILCWPKRCVGQILYQPKHCVGPNILSVKFCSSQILSGKYCVSQNILLAKTLFKLIYFDNKDTVLAKYYTGQILCQPKHFSGQNIVSAKIFWQPRYWIGQNIVSTKYCALQFLYGQILCRPNIVLVKTFCWAKHCSG